MKIKNDSIPTKLEKLSSNDLEFLCSQILLFIMGTCLPWRVEAIDVNKNGGSFEGVVEWSEN